MARRLGNAKLRQQACLEDLDYRSVRGLDRAVIARLSTGSWLRQGQHVRLLQEAVVMWLAVLNTRHLKKVNLPLIAAFVAGLVWTRGRASCSAIAAGGAFTHDALNRLLRGQSLRAVLQMAALTVVDRYGGYLVIDDVVWEKRGKLIAGVTKLFMSSESRYVNGLNVVVLAWTNGKGIRVPLTFRFWKKPAWKKDKLHSYNAFDGSVFRTKNELAIELLDWAFQRGFQPTAVLFDAAYPSGQMLRYLHHRQWQWVARIKGNRRMTLSGKEFRPDDWEAEAKAKRAPKLNSSLVAHLPGWGCGTIDRLYGHRWGIETIFRDGKQLAGLGDCHCQDRPIALAAPIVASKVRPVKLEKRQKRQDAHPVRRSDGAA